MGLSEHLSTAAKNGRYLFPQIQNEMLNCLGESIHSALIYTNIRKSKCISVMADEILWYIDDRTTGSLHIMVL